MTTRKYRSCTAAHWAHPTATWLTSCCTHATRHAPWGVRGLLGRLRTAHAALIWCSVAEYMYVHRNLALNADRARMDRLVYVGARPPVWLHASVGRFITLQVSSSAAQQYPTCNQRVGFGWPHLKANPALFDPSKKSLWLVVRLFPGWFTGFLYRFPESVQLSDKSARNCHTSRGPRLAAAARQLPGSFSRAARLPVGAPKYPTNSRHILAQPGGRAGHIWNIQTERGS